MPCRPKGRDEGLIPIPKRRFLAALRTSLLLLAVCAPRAGAEPDDLELETSEGSFTIRFFDHPDALEHQQEFVKRHPPGSNMAFHRSDVPRCSDGSLDCFFFCECSDLLFVGVCEGDERSCDCIGETCEVEGEPCDCQEEPFFPEEPVCTDDVERTCELPGDSYWIDPADERLDARVLYPALIEVDDENHVARAVDWMDGKPNEFRTKRSVWENDPLTIAFVRECIGDPGDCADLTLCDESDWQLTGEWIINRGEDTGAFDSGGDCAEEAYLVLGTFIDTVGALERIANYRTFDASEDEDLGDAADEFDQVPVVGTFEPGDALIEPCGEGDPGHPECAMPPCIELSADGLGCENPRCLEVDTSGEEPVCVGPVLPSFPLLVPEPGGLWLQTAALLALAALRRSRRPQR